jgi:hypothetical protein
MSEHAVAQAQKVNAPQVMTRCTDALQRRATNQIEPTAPPERLFDAVASDFSEPRFGYDFSRVRLLTNGTLPSLRARPMVQRFPSNGAKALAPDVASAEAETTPTPTPAEPTAEPVGPEPETIPAPAEPTTEPATPDETPAPGLLVEDSATELVPGQMRKSEFLADLRAAICAATEPVLARTGRTTDGCPYLDYWFDYYSQRDAQHGERALRRYAPEASRATSARDYIPIVAERVRQGVERWTRTGEVTGVPEGVPTSVPGETPPSEGSAAAGPVLFKARDGGARPADDPQAVQAQLGDGRSLDSGVRSRMESAFGTTFSHVRMHTDSNAAYLSSSMNARAFTVGEHVAFDAGEYLPGTPFGDALIAHELAHVLQQRGGSAFAAPMQEETAHNDALEQDADRSAVGAVSSLWNKTKDSLTNTAMDVIPSLRSGLRLQRCSKSTSACAHPGHERTVDLQPVFFRSSAADPSPTGGSWTRRFNSSNVIWGKLGVTYAALSARTLTDPVNKTAGSNDVEANRIAALRTGPGIEVFLVDNDMASRGGASSSPGSGASSNIVMSDRGTSDTLLAHELGHVLGLDHPPTSADSNTIMEPSSSHSTANPTRNTMGNYNRITWPAPGAATCLNPDT